MISTLFEKRIDWRRYLPRDVAFSDRFINFLPWAVATLFIAGIVHLVSVLLMPAIAPDDALARLTRYARGAETDKGVLLLPPINPDAVLLPFEDPAFEEAVCLYDLSRGPFRLRAPADGEDFIGLSFHASAGRLYHSMTDRAAIKGNMDIVIGDAAQIETLTAADDPESPPQDIRLTAPTRRGFVLIRSLAKRESDHARARERLRTVSCDYFELPKE